MDAERPIRIGLALSGGVARGAAHIGVLDVLERAGIPIDCLSGVSAGSLVGAMYCAGLDAGWLRALAPLIGWRRLAAVTWPSRGFLRFEKIERWLVQTIGDVRFEDLQRPFAVMATDIPTGLPIILREGRLASAVHASCAVPGIVVPVKRDGRLLGDGGVSCNVPVPAARALGADFVIGVDLMQPKLRRRWGALGFGLAALETLVRRSGGGADAADFVIVPDLAGTSYVRFRQFARLIEIGAQAVEAALPDLRAALEARGVCVAEVPGAADGVR